MWSSVLVAALMLQTAAVERRQAPPAATPAADWLVIVAAPVYQRDGGVTTETTPLPMAGAGLVHMFARRSVCDPAATGSTEPTDAGFGWRVASQIISRSERDVVISLAWRRLWDGGRKVSGGPGGTVQLTLHPGDRIPLDLITNASPRADCGAVGLGLEVRLGRAAVVSPTPASMIPLGATPGGAKKLDAEFWLIHTLPSGAEQVMHQAVRVPVEGGAFGFAPMSVETARGSVNVQLTGSLDRYRAPSGGEFLVMSMTRLVTGDGLPAAGVSSNTASVIPLPSPAEVPIFEITGPVGGGARGGRGAARGAGGVAAAGGGAAGGVVARPPQQTPAAGVQVLARGGSGTVPVAVLLEGHQFALKLRVTQVN